MTTTAPPGAPVLPTASPVRELWTNRWLQCFLAVWALAVAHIALTDRSVLPLSDQEPLASFSGVLGAGVSLAVLFRLDGGTAPGGSVLPGVLVLLLAAVALLVTAAVRSRAQGTTRVEP